MKVIALVSCSIWITNVIPMQLTMHTHCMHMSSCFNMFRLEKKLMAMYTIYFQRVILVKGRNLLNLFFFIIFFFDVLHNNVGNALYMDTCLLFLQICWIFRRVACFLGEFERTLPFYHVLKQPHMSSCTSTLAQFHVALITTHAYMYYNGSRNHNTH